MFVRGVCLASFVAGCGAPSIDAEAGRETGACIEGECFDGLECLSELCVGPDASSETESGPVTSASASTSSSSGETDAPQTSGDPAGPGPGPGPGPGSETGSESESESESVSVSVSLTNGESSTSTSDGESEASSEGETTGRPLECDPPVHAACDEAGNAFRAIGINCPDEPHFDVTTSGSAGAIAMRTGFGETETWAPTEGSRFAVIGTGFTTDLDSETPEADPPLSPTHCSDDLGAEYDVGVALPAPLDETEASIAANWSASGAFDFTELRLEGEAPGGATSMGFDFAFFSAEYPGYVDSQFNDMFVAWLESESWTGNLAFDDSGEAITQSSELVTLRDDMAMLPELAGTCMRGHSGSGWLHTTAPVAQGEELVLVFAIFDLADSIVDSYAFIDNVTWACDELDDPSTTALP